ncbi:DUF192 domain-containing protein [Halomonas sp. PR-M31]|uniref:DUF192 domain-containing protein n=1 Tax=Halomonas sp. PR-M31 TaxID=1471202 RepID=UPI0020A1204A|nr:DUF192 domain-containing protein [Halomonas sp. PR-M31]
MSSAGALERDNVVIEGKEETHRLVVEIARTAQERSFGLMERDHLAEEAGMLFIYEEEQSPSSGFWMYRTRIPLDIAFLDKNGEIRAIHSMPSCKSEQAARCPSYPAQVPFQAALEVNAGYFDARGIKVGDRLTLP